MSTPNVDEAQIKSVLEGMVSGLMSEEVQGASVVLGAAKIEFCADAISRHRPDLFALHSQAQGGSFSETLAYSLLKGKPKAQFLYGQHDFVARHVRGLIEDYEGGACCADKTRTVMRRLSQFLLEGSRIEFDYTAQYTFHLPTRVLLTHELIEAFFEGLYGLGYGRPTKYFEAYQAVILAAKTKGDDPSAVPQ